MASPITPNVIEQLQLLVRQAGDAIMAVYQRRDSYQVQVKGDDSPLTAADLAAQSIISKTLPAILKLPQVSEEGQLCSFNERKEWGSYWLVDPLDGTKEFIAGSGEFTVNIALVRDHLPVLGIVHAPVLDSTYLGVLEASDNQWLGAWKSQGGGAWQAIRCDQLAPRHSQAQPLRVLFSHRHSTNATQELIARLQAAWRGGLQPASAGSSLKFCLIAEGAADFYPRLAPTCEWDTAAAQAVLVAAGGAVVTALQQAEGENLTAGLAPLRYNLREDPINPFFYAFGDSQFDWRRLLLPRAP